MFMSHEFQTVYCNWVQRKSPLILKVVVEIAYVARILTSKNKNVNYKKWFWCFQDEWTA